MIIDYKGFFCPFFRSPILATFAILVFSGGPGRTRTSNLWFRRPALFPVELRDLFPAGASVRIARAGKWAFSFFSATFGGPGRDRTDALQIKSLPLYLLSYRSEAAPEGWRCLLYWWRGEDSNLRYPGYEPGALPLSYLAAGGRLSYMSDIALRRFLILGSLIMGFPVSGLTPKMARMAGFEPATSGVTSQRSDHLSYNRMNPPIGRGEGISVGAPRTFWLSGRRWPTPALVIPARFERATCRFGGDRSFLLSYGIGCGSW